MQAYVIYEYLTVSTYITQTIIPSINQLHRIPVQNSLGQLNFVNDCKNISTSVCVVVVMVVVVVVVVGGGGGGGADLKHSVEAGALNNAQLTIAMIFTAYSDVFMPINSLYCNIRHFLNLIFLLTPLLCHLYKLMGLGV